MGPGDTEQATVHHVERKITGLAPPLWELRATAASKQRVQGCTEHTAICLCVVWGNLSPHPKGEA